MSCKKGKMRKNINGNAKLDHFRGYISWATYKFEFTTQDLLSTKWQSKIFTECLAVFKFYIKSNTILGCGWFKILTINYQIYTTTYKNNDLFTWVPVTCSKKKSTNFWYTE